MLAALPAIAFALFIVIEGGPVFALGVFALGWICLHELFAMYERAHPVRLAGLHRARGAARRGAVRRPSRKVLLAAVASLPLLFLLTLTPAPASVSAGWRSRCSAIFWIGLALAHAVMLRQLPHGEGIVIDVLVGTFLGDTGAYLGGRLFGRRPLAPSISPGKTVEGLVIGMTCAVVAVWLAGRYQEWLPGTHALVLGLGVALAGPVGDLFESFIKREAGVKDAGQAVRRARRRARPPRRGAVHGGRRLLHLVGVCALGRLWVLGTWAFRRSPSGHLAPAGRPPTALAPRHYPRSDAQAPADPRLHRLDRHAGARHRGPQRGVRAGRPLRRALVGGAASSRLAPTGWGGSRWSSPTPPRALREAWDGGEVLGGAEGLVRLVVESGAELVLNALVGSAGLGPTVATLGEGIDLALANKESLVVGGELVTALAEATGAQIVPVDSEHTALHQLLAGQPPGAVERLTITASGGPFRGAHARSCEEVTVAQALAHPTWAMGSMNTIGSATLMNKGLELMEAHHLFGTPYERIDVVVHPQSLVHGLIQLADGAHARPHRPARHARGDLLRAARRGKRGRSRSSRSTS